ncbi:MAG TPA: hypothetical protein ENN28_01730 [Candidatus Uhrbacteria bacterium]|nr:hypothetical protein [Candidatus Uhrbacteria bacterium]
MITQAKKKILQETNESPESRLERKRFESFKDNYLEMLKDPDIPNIYKVFLRQKDIIMLLGKLKPMTEFQVQEENIAEFTKKGYWAEDSLKGFLELLKNKFGVDNFEEYRDGNNALYRIYDQEQIKEQIKKFPKLVAWDDSMQLNQWIDANLDQGVPIDYVKGALYGFPKSSIDFYLEKGGFMDIEMQGIGTYGEDYGVPKGELSPDVIFREEAKNKFFKQFESDQDIQVELQKTNNLKEELLNIIKEIRRKRDEQDERLKK